MKQRLGGEGGKFSSDCRRRCGVATPVKKVKESLGGSQSAAIGGVTAGDVREVTETVLLSVYCFILSENELESRLFRIIR